MIKSFVLSHTVVRLLPEVRQMTASEQRSRTAKVFISASSFFSVSSIRQQVDFNSLLLVLPLTHICIYTPWIHGCGPPKGA